MAIGIQNQTNITPADSNYPDGSLRDNPGNNTGTNFDKRVYDDFHQFFAKLLRLAGITASGLPDNEYSGFQYVDAAKISFQRYQKRYVCSGALITIAPIDQALVYGFAGFIPGQQVQLPTISTAVDGQTVRVVNDNPSDTIDILANVNIDYLQPSPYTVPISSIREFTLIKSILTWVVSDK